MLREAYLEMATSGVAALPALPLGRGPLILILGGFFVLLNSLLWSLLYPGERARGGAPPPRRRRRARRRTLRRARRDARREARRRVRPITWTPPAPAGPDVGRRDGDAAWLDEVSAVTRRMGFGAVRPTSEWPHTMRMHLSGCVSCQTGTTGAAGCEVERQALKCAVDPFLPEADVVEVLCDARHEGACVFEIRDGGPSSP